MKKKILITGITSEIMQRLVPLIDFSEYDVIGISRNSVPTHWDNVKIIPGDICDSDKLVRHIEGCYLIIHAAAVTHSFKGENYYRVNLDATKKIVDIARVCGVRKFIFISSNTAGKESGTYGLTKFLAEKYIQNNFHCWVIIRLSEIYGGSKLEGIEKLIHNVIAKPVVICPLDIPSKFRPIYIDDAVKKIQTYTFHNKHINKTVTINGPEELSFQDVISTTCAVAKKKVAIVYIKRQLMFLIMKLAQKIPFFIGVIPDQIARLYSAKCHEKSNDNLMKIETYIKKIVKNRKPHNKH